MIKFDLLYERANANSKIGNFYDVVDDCNKALAINSKNVNVRLLRAQSNYYLEQFEMCIQDYEFLQSSPEIHKNSEKAAEIETKLQIARTEMQHYRAKMKCAYGNERFNLQHYESAEQFYTEAIDLWPDNIIYYGNRATCFIMMHKYKRALQDSQRMIEIDQNFTMAHDRLARCCLILGDYDGADKAIETLEQNNYDADKCSAYKSICNEVRSKENEAKKRFISKFFYSAGK